MLREASVGSMESDSARRRVATIGAAAIAAAAFLAGCGATPSPLTASSAPPVPVERPAKVPPTINDLPRATGPDRAQRWRRMAWLDESGGFSLEKVRRGRAERAANLAWSIAQGGGVDGAAGSPGTAASDSGWQEHGPSNVGGRTRSLLVDPNDPDRLFAGSVGGGIWRSEDGGESWSPVDEWMESLAIGCLAADPSDPSVLYAGTGEGYFNGDAIGGAGIYRSIDNGLTWSQLPSTADWDNVCRIAVSSADPNVILAAKRYGGILRTTDGGLSWSTTHWAQGGYYVAFDPADPTRAIATVIDYDFDAGNWFHRALYSTNAGASWTPAAGLDHRPGFSSRIELDHHDADPSIVYAVCGENGTFWRSEDGGASYLETTVSGSTGTSWYCAPVWASPTDPDLVFGGGYVVRSSNDGGATIVDAGNGYILTEQPHPDIHFFREDPGWNGRSNRRFYVCTDGGVFVADDLAAATPGSGWRSVVNDYRTTQFYGAAGAALPPAAATAVDGATSGVSIAYYALDSPELLPDFDTLVPFASEIVPAIDFPSTGGMFAGSGLADNVGAVVEGWLDVPLTDLYTLSVESDDGSRLLIDGQLVVDNDGLHGMVERFGSVALVAGQHALRVEFFERGGGAGLIARIEGGGLERQTIPAPLLAHGGTASGTVAEEAPVLLIVGGTQDNGTLRVTDRSSTAVLDFGGDGGFCAVDAEDPRFVYGEYVGLRIHRSTDGGRTAGYIWSGITDVDNGLANFIAPFVLDPNDPKTLLAGGRSLWRTLDARAETVAWSAASPPFSTNISAIAVAPGDPDHILVGLNNGEVHATLEGTLPAPAWTAIDDNGANNPLPNRFATRLVFDPGNANTIYACFGGFEPDNLWRSVDGGVNWAPVQGRGATALPAVPIRGLAVHPDDSQRLYAGTEFGLFVSADGGATWSTNESGPTAVSIDEVVFLPATRTVLLATHGRGLWTRDLALAPVLPGDLDGDGLVNGADLGLLLAAWGTDDSVADLDGNGVVDGADLGALLAAWSE